MENFTYKKYTPEYKNQVIKLLSVLWNFDKEARENYFRWKFEENPYTDNPLAFIALDGEKVVSFRGYMVQPIRIGNTIIMNAALADTVTDAKYRRMGLFKGITAYSIKEIETEGFISMSTNSSSGGPTLKGYTSLGWYPISERKHKFKITPLSIIKHVIHQGHKDLPIQYNLCMISEHCDSYAIGNLFCQVFDKSHFIVNSDEDYIAWRFRNPQSKFIFSYKYDTNGNLVACAIVKQISNGKYDLVEYFGKNISETRAAIDTLWKVLNPIYIIHWTVSQYSPINLNQNYFGFRSLDFILDRFQKFKKPPFLVRFFPNVIKQKNVNNVTSIGWNINKVIADEI